MGCFGANLPYEEYYKASAKTGEKIVVYLNVPATFVDSEDPKKDKNKLEKEGYVLIGFSDIDDIAEKGRCRNIMLSQANMLKASKIYVYQSENLHMKKVKKDPFKKIGGNPKANYEPTSKIVYSAYYYAERAK